MFIIQIARVSDSEAELRLFLLIWRMVILMKLTVLLIMTSLCPTSFEILDYSVSILDLAGDFLTPYRVGSILKFWFGTATNG